MNIFENGKNTGEVMANTAALTPSYPVADPASPYSVIKCYEDLEETEETETEEYVPVNTYIYNHAPANLTIEDEEDYKVWKSML